MRLHLTGMPKASEFIPTQIPWRLVHLRIMQAKYTLLFLAAPGARTHISFYLNFSKSRKLQPSLKTGLLFSQLTGTKPQQALLPRQ